MQSLRDKLKKLNAPDLNRDALPLRAFYGREPGREVLRNRMYEMVSRQLTGRDWGASEVTFRIRQPVFLPGGGHASIINDLASPVEYLVSRGEMETDLDDEGVGGARYHTAVRLRELLDGAQVKGLKSPSLDVLGGGGGSGTVDIGSYQIDCILKVERLMRAMPDWLFPMVSKIVWEDEWFDLMAEGSLVPRKARQREETLLALHYGLDVIAAALGYEMEACVPRRWGDELPKLPAAVRRHKLVTTVRDQLSLRT